MNLRARSVLICCFGIVAAFAAVAEARAAEYPRVRSTRGALRRGRPTDVLGRLWANISAGSEAAVFVETRPARKAPSAPTRWRVPNPTVTRCLSRRHRSSCSIRCCTRSCPTSQGFSDAGAGHRFAVVMEVIHRCRPGRCGFVAYAKQIPARSISDRPHRRTIHLAGEMFKQMAGSR